MLFGASVDFGAEHVPLVPPLLPLQVQFHGPAPVTADAAPDEHRLSVGATAAATAFAEPQTPLTTTGVEL